MSEQQRHYNLLRFPQCNTAPLWLLGDSEAYGAQVSRLEATIMSDKQTAITEKNPVKHKGRISKINETFHKTTTKQRMKIKVPKRRSIL